MKLPTHKPSSLSEFVSAMQQRSGDSEIYRPFLDIYKANRKYKVFSNEDLVDVIEKFFLRIISNASSLKEFSASRQREVYEMEEAVAKNQIDDHELKMSLKTPHVVALRIEDVLDLISDLSKNGQLFVFVWYLNRRQQALENESFENAIDYDQIMDLQDEFEDYTREVFKENAFPPELHELSLQSIEKALKQGTKPSSDKPIVKTRKNKLKSVEIALAYYLFFKAIGLKSKDIKQFFGIVIYEVKKGINREKKEEISHKVGLSKYITSAETLSQFNDFSHAFFKSIQVKDKTGDEQINKYIQYSDSKSTVFLTKSNDDIDKDKLRGYWKNFIDLSIDFDTFPLQEQFNQFIIDPISYLKGE